MAVSKTLSFKMQRQEQTQWCWSAVAISVRKFYKPKDTGTQCKVAKTVLGSASCCTNKPSCNETAALDDALVVVTSLNSVWPAGDFRFEHVLSEINAGKPIGGRIEYDAWTGHFVAIVGYYNYVTTAGTYRATYVKDPYLGDTVVWGDDTTGYDGGAWTHFYTTRGS